MTTLRPVVDVLVIQESVLVPVLSIHVITSSVKDPQSRQTMLLYWYPDFIFLPQKFVVVDDDKICRGGRRCDPLWTSLLYRNPYLYPSYRSTSSYCPCWGDNAVEGYFCSGTLISYFYNKIV